MRWGIVNKTKWALYAYAPFSASGRNEILAMGQTKRQMLLLAASEGIHVPSSGQGQWRIEKIDELTKPVPPKKGEPGYVLTFAERMEFEKKWDAMIDAQRRTK